MESLTWLENNLWLAIYTTTSSPPSSTYHIITRDRPGSFTFQKITDPVEPFAPESAPHHSVLRVRNFPPDLQDLLIVASTASTDIGLLSRSSKALATDQPADNITGVFTTTELLDDTKRPTLPMTDDMDDSTPIGIALDLSSKDKVYKPIPADEELEESHSPLPGLWVLTHEGILCPWWLIYQDSIKQKTTYPGLAVLDSSAPTPAGSLSTTAAPSAFSPSTGSAFGSASSAPAFGSASQLGQKTSPWGSSNTPANPQTGGPTFGSSTFGAAPATSSPQFGKPSALAFGQSSMPGRQSPWSGGGSGGPVFGQSGLSNLSGNANSGGNAFGASANSNQTSGLGSGGGFAGFANKSGFASLGGDNSGGSIFGSGGTSQSKPVPFGSTSTDTAFPPPKDKPSGSVFGSQEFKLQSSFKPDPSAKDDNEKPSGSLFGSGFGSALTDASKKAPSEAATAKDEDMDSVVSAEPSVEQTPQAKPAAKSIFESQKSPESTTPTTTPGPMKFNTTTPAQQTSIFGNQSSAKSSIFGNSTTPATQPPAGIGLFGNRSGSTTTPGQQPSTFGQPSSIFGTPKQSLSTFGAPSKGSSNPFSKISEDPETPKAKSDETPLPPDTTSRMSYPIGDSSSSSASKAPSSIFGSTTTPSKPDDAPLPPDATPKPTEDAKPTAETPAPGPDFATTISKSKTPQAEDAAPRPNPFSVKQEASDTALPAEFTSHSRQSSFASTIPEDETDAEHDEEEEPLYEEEEDEGEEEEAEEEEEDDRDSEGSGVDVAKDLSPETTGVSGPGMTPQSSFGAASSTTPATAVPGQGRQQTLFGELSRNGPTFARPSAASPRSPSPLRGGVPPRVTRPDTARSVSAPHQASNTVGSKQPPQQSQLRGNAISSNGVNNQAEDTLVAQRRKLKARQETEETQLLVDEEYEEIQKILASEVNGTLELDEFLAHTNVAPPAQDSIPSQVEAVYRDINSMIDSVGLNSRAVKAFVKGHSENASEEGRNKDDLEIPEDWVLCEAETIGQVLDHEVYPELENGRVTNLQAQLACLEEIEKDTHRLWAKQRDLKQIMMAQTDPDQAASARSMPLSTEQATQQNELRREFTKFTKLMAETEEALIMLKTKIASASSVAGRSNPNVPTVEAVMRTITKMTTMVEKRSGDVDVLENQLRKLRLQGSTDRDGSPVTPQARRSVMFSPDSTPSRNPRASLMSSVTPLGVSTRNSLPPRTPPRKKLSGFSTEEKTELMEKKARRQSALRKLKEGVEKKGVHIWTMEDVE